MLVPLMVAILCAGALASARLYLGCHNGWRFNFSSIFMLEKSDLIILLFCAAVVLAIDKLYHSSFIQTYKKAVNEYENTPYWSPKIGFVLGAVVVYRTEKFFVGVWH